MTDDFRKMAEESVMKAFDVKATIMIMRENGLNATADEYALGSEECISAVVSMLESTASRHEQIGWEKAVESCAKVAEHQATICGSSLSRQSTSHDIAFNIRRIDDGLTYPNVEIKDPPKTGGGEH